MDSMEQCPLLQAECDVPQIHLLSLELEPRLHHGCPPNCCDRFSWLPHNVSLQILSFLDPGMSSKHTLQHLWTPLGHTSSKDMHCECEPHSAHTASTRHGNTWLLHHICCIFVVQVVCILKLSNTISMPVVNTLI